MLAPPGESHEPLVHALASPNATIVHGADNHTHANGIEKFFGGGLTAIHPKHFEIQWIRIYKNPETMSLEELGAVDDKYHYGLSGNGPAMNYVVTPPEFEYRRARLFPSLRADYEPLRTGSPGGLEALKAKYFWVKIEPGDGPSDPNSGGLIDTGDNSGLVTATENNTVVPGDIVAIAINVKLHYYEAEKEPTHTESREVRWNPTGDPRTGDFAGPVGPTYPGSKNHLPLSPSAGAAPWAPTSGNVWARNWKDADLNKIAGGAIIAAVYIDPVGILNPNYPLERMTTDAKKVWWQHADSSVTHINLDHKDKAGYHTLVYQFEVTDEHLSLNADEWLERKDGNVNPFNVAYDNFIAGDYAWASLNNHRSASTHQARFGFWVPFGANNIDTDVAGRDLASFLNPAQFIAAAGASGGTYIPYPDSPSTSVDNDPEITATDVQVVSGIDQEYTGGLGTILKSGQYRHWSDSYSSHEANRLISQGRTTVNFEGVYKRGAEASWPYTFKSTDLDRNGDGLIDYFPVVDDVVDYVPPDPYPTTNPDKANADKGVEDKRTANGRVRHYSVSAGFYSDSRYRPEFPHHKPPTYDTAKGPIHYPTVISGYVGATPKLDVPSGPQTDTFMVTLRFQEDYGDFQLAPDHDTSEDVLAALQAALAANVANGTVTGLSRLGTEDDATRYQVTLVPALGVDGELTFRVPANTVVAQTSGLGNLEATFTVPIDTTLPALEVGAPEIIAPEADVYNAGDKLTVEVPFATTGLTYEGENPPYVRIYLGEKVAANARDAIWQQGEERSGSTIVPFVYVLQASDVDVLQALDPADQTVHPDVSRLGIPAGTRIVDREAGLALQGSDRVAVDAGVVAPPLSDAGDGGLSLQDASGSEPGPVTLDVPVPPKPVIYLPPTETDPKAVASSVPRSPIVFNELGNGSGDSNDWLELRNVSGSDVSLKDWELSVVADGKKEDTSLIVFPDVSVPANSLLLITNSASDKTPLAGGENRGLSHASLVNPGLSLPDDGKFLLILRNAKEKLGLDEAFIDVAGGGGSDTDAFIRDETGDYDTHVWPLQVLEAPGDATEDALSSGKVWQRAKADIIGYHRDAWAEAAFTGIGYDRKVSKSAATSGTPGYPNGALKTEAATPKGAVTISEIMFDSEGGTLPQWIELYNKSKTEALNLNRWQLEIQNRNSPDLVGRPIVTLTLQEKVIQPNQTLLIVAGTARASSADVFPEDRVYNLLELHEKNLRIKTPRDTFLSGEGFYLKLSDRNGTKIDEVGNIDDNRRTDDAPVWVWPTNLLGRARSSVVRRYDKGTSQARDGMVKSSWALAGNFNQFKVESLHYGHADDIGTPGYRKGGALPVELSSFTVTRTDAGPVIVTWTTESEVDNAGFNLRRSLKRDSGFTLLNPVLIAGAGTTGERQTYTFTDTSAKPGVEYYYQIEEVSLGGRPETLRTRRLPGPVSPANRSLTTFGEVKQRE